MTQVLDPYDIVRIWRVPSDVGQDGDWPDVNK